MEDFFAVINTKVDEIKSQKKEDVASLAETAKSELVDDEDAESIYDDYSSESSNSAEEDMLIDHQGIDAKLKYIKDTDAEDKSSVALGLALKYMVVIYGIIYLSALILFNLLPNPVNWLIMMDKLADVSNTIGDAVGAARQLQLQQVTGITDGYPCSWVPGAPDACAFANKNNVSKDLEQINIKLEDLNEWFSTQYVKLRTPGDSVDAFYTAQHEFYEFVGGNPNLPVKANVQSWAELTIAKLRPYLLTLTRNNNIDASRLAWNFIIYNRDIFYDSTYEIITKIPIKFSYLLEIELIAHFVITIVLLATSIVSSLL